jgi:hypothetical protein
MTDDNGHSDDARDPDLTTEPDSGSRLPGCRFILVSTAMIFVMFILATILWQRIRSVDPLRRCEAAYNSSYTPVDTSLVDQIKVRTPDGEGRTTCGELRATGLIDQLPKKEVRSPFEPR